MASKTIGGGVQERYLPRSSGLPHDNVQINGWGRISGIWGMRTRERKGRAESLSQGRWQVGEISRAWQDWNPDSVWTSMRTPSPGA